MTKLDSNTVRLTLPTASFLDPKPARSVLILVPETEADTANAARRVWELAKGMNAQVQFLGLCKDAMQELSLRRKVAAMSAMVQDGKVFAEAKVEIGTNWVDFVKRNARTGDMIVCFGEQRIGLLHRPLRQILESNLNIPVYILSGLDPQKPKSNWLLQGTAWMGSIGIIFGFFLLQVKIEQLPNDWFQNTFLIFSIIPELWLTWIWNRLFG
jgi:hypothetical protein